MNKSTCFNGLKKGYEPGQFFLIYEYGILCPMKQITFLFFFLTFSSASVAENMERLQAKDWAIPKQASTVLKMPSIQSTMNKLDKEQDSILILRYPGGDEGTLWANELRSWLVALGLSSNRIVLVPGSSAIDIIELEIKS